MTKLGLTNGIPASSELCGLTNLRELRLPFISPVDTSFCRRGRAGASARGLINTSPMPESLIYDVAIRYNYSIGCNSAPINFYKDDNHVKKI